MILFYFLEGVWSFSCLTSCWNGRKISRPSDNLSRLIDFFNFVLVQDSTINYNILSVLEDNKKGAIHIGIPYIFISWKSTVKYYLPLGPWVICSLSVWLTAHHFFLNWYITQYYLYFFLLWLLGVAIFHHSWSLGIIILFETRSLPSFYK